MIFNIKLKPGKYNGQVCKILLHPSFESVFDETIDQRLNNYKIQHVCVRIDSFVDALAQEYTTIDILLSRSGMSLNLIYISPNENTDNLLNQDSATKPYSQATGTDDDRGYWMFLDNNIQNV